MAVVGAAFVEGAAWRSLRADGVVVSDLVWGCRVRERCSLRRCGLLAQLGFPLLTSLSIFVGALLCCCALCA